MRKSKARMSQRIREGRVRQCVHKVESYGLFIGMPVPDYTDSRLCVTTMSRMNGGRADWSPVLARAHDQNVLPQCAQ